MTVEADIVATLGPLVDDRIYPDAAPFGVPLPYIEYHQVGGQAQAFWGRAVVPKKNGRFQINCWAASRVEAAALARLVEDTFVQATAFDAEAQGAHTAMSEVDLGLYGTMQDFSIWFDD